MKPTRDDLTAVYRVHVSMVRDRVAQFFSEPDAVQDITQETFLALVNVANTRDVEDVATSLYHLASRACLNALRLRRTAHNRLDVETLAVVDENVTRVEDQLMLKKALVRLDEDVALAALYYHVDGIDQADIAEILQVSRRTVIRLLQTFTKSAAKRLMTDPSENAETRQVGVIHDA